MKKYLLIVTLGSIVATGLCKSPDWLVSKVTTKVSCYSLLVPGHEYLTTFSDGTTAVFFNLVDHAMCGRLFTCHGHHSCSQQNCIV